VQRYPECLPDHPRQMRMTHYIGVKGIRMEVKRSHSVTYAHIHHHQRRKNEGYRGLNPAVILKCRYPNPLCIYIQRDKSNPTTREMFPNATQVVAYHSMEFEFISLIDTLTEHTPIPILSETTMREVIRAHVRGIAA
jgi:hypothetical protein